MQGDRWITGTIVLCLIAFVMGMQVELSGPLIKVDGLTLTVFGAFLGAGLGTWFSILVMQHNKYQASLSKIQAIPDNILSMGGKYITKTDSEMDLTDLGVNRLLEYHSQIYTVKEQVKNHKFHDPDQVIEELYDYVGRLLFREIQFCDCRQPLSEFADKLRNL